MTIIYFVRHGESEWNASGNRYCGRTDIKLSNIGKQQAQMAPTLLQDVQFTGAYPRHYAGHVKRRIHFIKPRGIRSYTK